MGPSVIYIDEAEKICANTGKKKVVNEGPARFKKDLPTYISSLTADDAVVVIGCSREPWLGDEKSFKSVPLLCVPVDIGSFSPVIPHV